MGKYLERLKDIENAREDAINDLKKSESQMKIVEDAYASHRLEVCLAIESITSADLRNCQISLEKLCRIAENLVRL